MCIRDRPGAVSEAGARETKKSSEETPRDARRDAKLITHTVAADETETDSCASRARVSSDFFAAASSPGDEHRAVALFSSLVFIAQCLGLLKEYDAAFPRGVDRVLDALDLTNLNLSALAPGCTDDSVNFYRSFVVGVSVPPAIVCVCALVYHRAEAARRRHYAAFPRRTRTEHDAYESLKRRCARNAAWLLTLAYSGTAKTVFQLYNARRLDTGVFLRRDYSINVTGSGARVYSTFRRFGAVALLAYPIGVPLAVAALLLVLAGAQGQPAAKLFPPPATLRSVLARCLSVLNVDAHGLAFVWHSFRHGGASRAYLRGDEMSRILTRGRWAVESSGRHYIQSGRQLLLAQELPPTVIDLARRLEGAGVESLLARDLRERLR